MALVRHKDTAPEMTVRKMLSRLGYRYRLHVADLPGKPDVVFRPRRKAIFVHGCFWHRHRGCARTRTPKTRVEFWTQKFADNVARDRSNRAKLSRAGWSTLVVWECVSEKPRVLERKLLKFLGDSN